MSYAIIRHNKLRSYAAIAAVGMHNGRLKEEGNVDALRSHRNSSVDGHDRKLEPGKGWLNKPIRDRLKELDVKVRKNAVLAIEVMMTTSPEWWDEYPEGSPERNQRGKAWLAEQKAYLRERFGADNIVAISLHVDEKTPHAHAVVMPLVQKIDGRSKSKEPKWKLDAFGAMRGGPKGASEIAQEYGRRMQKAFGLEPGEPAAVRRGRGENVEHVPIAVHQQQLQEERRKTEQERQKAEAAREDAEEQRVIAERLTADVARIKQETVDLRIGARGEIETTKAAAETDRRAASLARETAEHERTTAQQVRQQAEDDGRTAGYQAGLVEGKAAAEKEIAAKREAAERDKREAEALRKMAENDQQKAAAAAEKTIRDAAEAAREREDAKKDREAANDAKMAAAALESSWKEKNAAGLAEINRQKEGLAVERETLEKDKADLKEQKVLIAESSRKYAQASAQLRLDQSQLKKNQDQLHSDREVLEEREKISAAFEAGIDAWIMRKITGAFERDGQRVLDWTVEGPERKMIEERIKPAFAKVWALVNRAVMRLKEIHAEREARLLERERRVMESFAALDAATKARFSPAVAQQIMAAPGASTSPEEAEAIRQRLSQMQGRG